MVRFMGSGAATNQRYTRFITKVNDKTKAEAAAEKERTAKAMKALEDATKEMIIKDVGPASGTSISNDTEASRSFVQDRLKNADPAIKKKIANAVDMITNPEAKETIIPPLSQVIVKQKRKPSKVTTPSLPIKPERLQGANKMVNRYQKPDKSDEELMLYPISYGYGIKPLSGKGMRLYN